MSETSSDAPRVEFLWWRGCPSWDRALTELRAEMEKAGLDPTTVELREVETDDDADAEGFVGSPTIRIDGRDIQEPGEHPIGLTCRVYKLRDGRISALPDPLDISEALSGATEGAANR